MAIFVSKYDHCLVDLLFIARELACDFLSLDPDPRIKLDSGTILFAPDGQALAYIISGDNNVDNVWLQPLDGKPGRQITQFHSDSIFGLAWSPDQKKIQIPRGHVESDVVLLRDTTK